MADVGTGSIDTTAKKEAPDSSSADDAAPAAPAKLEMDASAVVSCPYLDTVNRTLLDFDFEPSCSVTLTRGPHTYGCLVCGKFFRGRGRSTPAHTHSVEAGHAVYVHLARGTFHCLPDNYEIRDPSLADIGAALRPTYSNAEIRALDDNAGLARDLFGRRYLPGFVGLNNLNKTDYINATVQALAHVRPLRDYFLRIGGPDEGIGRSDGVEDEKNGGKNKRDKKRKRDDPRRRVKKLDPSEHSPLVRAFGDLTRKMWSDRRFKSTVDPHFFVQAVSDASDKRYRVGRQAEAGEFLAWLLHQLHVGLGGTRKPGSSVIHEIFQGTVEVTTRQRRRRGAVEAARNGDGSGGGDEAAFDDDDDGDDRAGSEDEDDRCAREKARAKRRAAAEEMVIDETVATTRFLQLTLDIPEKPLFKDDEGGLVIPQEPLVSVLRKFDGETFSDAMGQGGVAQKRRYQLRKLPDHLILHLNRFKRNGFTVEKNPTIVAFPVKNLDLSAYAFSEGGKRKEKEKERVPTEEEVRAMSVKELRDLLERHGRSDVARGAVEKPDLVEACVDFAARTLPDLLAEKYDLVANITHHIPAEVGKEERRDVLQEGMYRCHVRHGASNKWYEIQDLHVEETMPQLIGISESYVLIFERKGVACRGPPGTMSS